MGNKQSKHEGTRQPTNTQQSANTQNDFSNTLQAIQYLEKLPKFDRKKQDFRAFVDAFINAQKKIKAQLEVKTAKEVFAGLFEDEELTLYNTIPHHLKSDDDWQGYANALYHVFHTRSGIDLAYQELSALKQECDESVVTFRTRIDHVARFAHPDSEEARVNSSLFAFLRGVRKSIRRKIIESGAMNNYNRAFELAQLFENNRLYEERLPLRRDYDEDEDGIEVNAISMKEESKSICYFSRIRKQSDETLPRGAQSEVSTDCGGDLTCMVDLAKNITNEFGIVNELELVLARGAGLFVDVSPKYANMNFIGQFICEEHLGELSRQWNSRKWQRHIVKRERKGERRKYCGITTHERDITKSAHFLNKDQAQKFLHHNHELLHVGLPICSAHAEEIDKLPAVERQTTEEPMDIEFTESDPEIVEDKKKTLQAAFAEFAEKAGVKGVAPSVNFGSLERPTQMRKVYAMKKLVKVMVALMAPNDEDKLMRLYLESLIPNAWIHKSEEGFAKVFEVVAEQYEKTEDRRNKEIILSSIVNIIGVNDLRNYIPGLSSRKYYNAKIRARSNVPIAEPKIRRTRYEPIRLHYFINFITSPIVSTGLPYGERTVKTSDGSSISIPNTIRLHTNAEILRMYHKHMEDIGKKHLILKDTVAHGILKKCSATRRHALTCVDYFMADGADAFEDIDDILDTLQGLALLDSDMAKLLKYNVAQSRLYLKTDFRMHLKTESQVIDHCYLHSLSDKDDSNFKCEGHDHTHTVRCPRCVMMEKTFEEIQSLVDGLNSSMKESNPSKKTVVEMEIRMKQNVARIMEMKMHLVRAGFTDQERTRLISELNDGEAFVTLDFAQKFLPTYKWESQRKYFGKRGMPWHIFHIIAKINGAYVQHSFVHVLKTKKQDNHSVVQMLDHVMSKLRNVKISGIHLRADNAGAYHSLGTIASIPHLAEKNNVKVLSLSFSEAQNGKSSCDRVAAQVKRKLRDYVARGKNIENVKDLFKAIAASGLRGISAYLASVKREKTEAAENALAKTLRPKIDGISNFGHFAFDGNTVTAWRMHGIGKGKIFKDLSGFKRTIKIEDEGGFLASLEHAEADEASMKKDEAPQKFWTAYLSKKGKTEEEPDDVDEIDKHGQETIDHRKESKGLFTCHECGATFLKYGNLLRHLDVGRHRIRPEKIHLYDHALQLFKQNLEDIQAHNNILTEVSEAMTEMGNGEDQSGKQGWALRGKRKKVEYSEKAKKFARSYFEQGEASGRKIDPPEVERLMKEDVTIKPYERMNAQQIRSFFGTLSKNKKAAKVSVRRGKKGVENEEKDDMEDEEENDYDDLSEEDEANIDDFGRDMSDVIHDMVRDNFKEFFTEEATCLDDDDDVYPDM